MELRPYQRECLEQLRARYRAGKRRLLVSLPTGTGKTVVFAQFPRFFGMKRRLLVLAHREELLDQAVAKFRAVDPSLSVAVEQAGRRAGDARVVVASVATLRGRRLDALDPEEFYLVVVDEAHHAVAPSYRAIFEHLGLMESDTRRLLVGFTATPRRGDGEGLGAVFQEIAYSQGLEAMIAAGHLCRVTGWRISTSVDLDGVKVRAGDFVESQLADAVDTAERNELIVDAYRRLAPARRAVVFCASVAHAQAVAEAFRKDGLRAASVWGAMPPDERHTTLATLHAGGLDAITNCNVLTEGFDEPSIDCVLMARPTRSLMLYAQMVGRGTRLAPGKENLVVIDVADNTRRHTLAGLHALFDLPDTLNLAGSDALETAVKIRDIAERMPWVDLARVETPAALETAIERVDLFRFEPPDEIADDTDFAWMAGPSGFRLGLPGGDWVTVEPSLLGGFEARLFARGREPEVIAQGRDAAVTVAAADDEIRERAPDAVRVLDRDAAWRDREPTEKQLQLLRARRLPVPEGLTRGQASWMLSYALAPR